MTGRTECLHALATAPAEQALTPLAGGEVLGTGADTPAAAVLAPAGGDLAAEGKVEYGGGGIGPECA